MITHLSMVVFYVGVFTSKVARCVDWRVIITPGVDRYTTSTEEVKLTFCLYYGPCADRTFQLKSYQQTTNVTIQLDGNMRVLASVLAKFTRPHYSYKYKLIRIINTESDENYTIPCRKKSCPLRKLHNIIRWKCKYNRFSPPLCDKDCHCSGRINWCEEIKGHCKEGCAAGYRSDGCQKKCGRDLRGYRYGLGCERYCSTHCSKPCNSVTGTCSCSPGYQGSMCYRRCKVGWYGIGCKHKCGGCKSKRVCDITNGVCHQGGCRDGYTGSKCQPCVNGTFGKDCSSLCHCFGDHQCDIVNGSCFSHGCALHYKGPACQRKEECFVGFYGKNCISCGKCWLECVNGTNICTGQCNMESGICPTKKCNHNFRGERCNICSKGKYGRACVYECGNCYDAAMCDTVTGLCSTGCSAGYLGSYCKLECRGGSYGKACNQKCSEHCIKGMCSHIDGFCLLGCQTGWTGNRCDRMDVCSDSRKYGPNCTELCGQCRNVLCYKISGFCLHGCKAGYMGPQCKQPCRPGFYGDGCLKQCGRCFDWLACSVTDGTCLYSCMGYFKMPLCQVCPDGFFGQECDGQCGHCKGRQFCNKLTGACPSGCAVGFTGFHCRNREHDENFYVDALANE